jgi:hypothetical protein
MCFCKNGKNKIMLRNTEDPRKTTVEFNHDEWSVFLAGVKDGEFDLKK